MCCQVRPLLGAFLIPPVLPVVTDYELIIYWSEADQVFIVEVPELAGCMADGGSYEEPLANAKSVIESWIETALAKGRPIPEPRGRLLYA